MRMIQVGNGTFQGSGKTHTIGGLNITSQTEEDFGVIPRAVKHMFEIMKVEIIFMLFVESLPYR